MRAEPVFRVSKLFPLEEQAFHVYVSVEDVNSIACFENFRALKGTLSIREFWSPSIPKTLLETLRP